MSREFKYSYSASTEKERADIERIKGKYQINSNNEKMERLKKLDRKVNNLPIAIALIQGIIGVLIFGTGLTMALEWDLMIWGIVVGFVGVIPMSVAYLVYNKMYSHLKNKYSKEIIELSDELLKENSSTKNTEKK